MMIIERIRLYLVMFRCLKQKRSIRVIFASILAPFAIIISYIDSIVGCNLLIKIFLTDFTLFDHVIAKRIKLHIPDLLEKKMSQWPEFTPDTEAEIMVLKSYKSEREKGVITVHWRWQVEVLVRNYDITRILGRYMIILEPEAFGAEWTFPFLFLSNTKKGVVFTTSKNINTQNRFKILGFKTIPHGLSCDYINEQFTCKFEEKKTIDVIMIANWSLPIKRHYVLFSALKKIKYPLNVVLVGMPYGNYTMEKIKNIESCYSLKHNIQYYENIPYDEVNILLNRSKMLVLTSLMEGPNRACFESFFVNVPAIILRGNLGVPKEYFLQQTGIISDERRLHKDIEYILKNHEKFSAQQWALNNITPRKTISKINQFLEKYSIENNMQWTGELVPKQWQFQKFTYVEVEDIEKFEGDYKFLSSCLKNK